MAEQLNLLSTSEFSAISLASQRDLHMMASIKAPILQSDIRDRAPIDLVAVIDKRCEPALMCINLLCLH